MEATRDTAKEEERIMEERATGAVDGKEERETGAVVVRDMVDGRAKARER